MKFIWLFDKFSRKFSVLWQWCRLFYTAVGSIKGTGTSSAILSALLPESLNRSVSWGSVALPWGQFLSPPIFPYSCIVCLSFSFLFLAFLDFFPPMTCQSSSSQFRGVRILGACWGVKVASKYFTPQGRRSDCRSQPGVCRLRTTPYPLHTSECLFVH